MKISHALGWAALLLCNSASADTLAYYGCARLLSMTPSEQREYENSLKASDGRGSEIVGRGGLRVQVCLVELKLAEAAFNTARSAEVAAALAVSVNQSR